MPAACKAQTGSGPPTEKRNGGSDRIDRAQILQDLSGQLEALTRLHIQHRLDDTPHFRSQKENISRFIREHQIDTRRELDHLPNLQDAGYAMARRGCWKAYTLDGGQTASTAFHYTLINPVQFGEEKAISDIIYFASAAPEE